MRSSPELKDRQGVREAGAGPGGRTFRRNTDVSSPPESPGRMASVTAGTERLFPFWWPGKNEASGHPPAWRPARTPQPTFSEFKIVQVGAFPIDGARHSRCDVHLVGVQQRDGEGQRNIVCPRGNTKRPFVKLFHACRCARTADVCTHANTYRCFISMGHRKGCVLHTHPHICVLGQCEVCFCV